jgi:FHA domain-containing protein/type VI secretion system protein
MTMLSVRANNPLKFFPHAEGALTQMLTGAMAGYMGPKEAMAGAFDDLRAHELAVIAGMRAALGAVLARFDPARIEARLAVPTVMDKMLASNRKAKLWDRLVELYGDIAREADDDLQRLYGEKFSEAYEEQVARLRAAKD